MFSLNVIMGGRAIVKVIDRLSGDDVFLPDLIREHFARRSNELAGPNPSAVVKLLAERVAFCEWALDDAHADLIAAENAGGLMWCHIHSHQSVIDRAHKRLMSAVKLMEQVRALEQVAHPAPAPERHQPRPAALPAPVPAEGNRIAAFLAASPSTNGHGNGH